MPVTVVLVIQIYVNAYDHLCKCVIRCGNIIVQYAWFQLARTKGSKLAKPKNVAATVRNMYMLNSSCLACLWYLK
jgi:hypothetical protein